jgi:hypothetical protein
MARAQRHSAAPKDCHSDGATGRLRSKTVEDIVISDRKLAAGDDPSGSIRPGPRAWTDAPAASIARPSNQPSTLTKTVAKAVEMETNDRVNFRTSDTRFRKRTADMSERHECVAPHVECFDCCGRGYRGRGAHLSAGAIDAAVLDRPWEFIRLPRRRLQRGRHPGLSWQAIKDDDLADGTQAAQMERSD